MDTPGSKIAPRLEKSISTSLVEHVENMEKMVPVILAVSILSLALAP
jgi:hypothetical protein